MEDWMNWEISLHTTSHILGMSNTSQAGSPLLPTPIPHPHAYTFSPRRTNFNIIKHSVRISGKQVWLIETKKEKITLCLIRVLCLPCYGEWVEFEIHCLHGHMPTLPSPKKAKGSQFENIPSVRLEALADVKRMSGRWRCLLHAWLCVLCSKRDLQPQGPDHLLNSD